MAYLNFLAVVSDEQIAQNVGGAHVTVVPSQVFAVSHFLACSVAVQPVGRLLGEALDGDARRRRAAGSDLRFSLSVHILFSCNNLHSLWR